MVVEVEPFVHGLFLFGVPAEQGNGDQVVRHPAYFHRKGVRLGDIIAEHEPLELVNSLDIPLLQPVVD